MPQRRRTCGPDHKVVFNTELDAKIALARPRDNNIRGHIPVRFYKCREHYHLTHIREWNERREDDGGSQGKENAARIRRVHRAATKAHNIL